MQTTVNRLARMLGISVVKMHLERPSLKARFIAASNATDMLFNVSCGTPKEPLFEL